MVYDEDVPELVCRHGLVTVGFSSILSLTHISPFSKGDFLC